MLRISAVARQGLDGKELLVVTPEAEALHKSLLIVDLHSDTLLWKRDLTKPADLMPELQGRFPIRVELASLSVADFEAILTSTHASLVRQYQALLDRKSVV